MTDVKCTCASIDPEEPGCPVPEHLFERHRRLHGMTRCPLGGHPPGECPRCDFDVANAERERAEAHAREWWATYRAALTGYCANAGEIMGAMLVDQSTSPQQAAARMHSDLHTMAKASADAAHGPLPKAKP